MQRLAAITLLTLTFAAADVRAQSSSDATSYQVTIPSLVSIDADESVAELQHSESNGNQRFPWLNWQVTNQIATGAIVTFETNQAFTHMTNSSYKRNARLRLRRLNSPQWRITQRRDETDYANGDEVATVIAESDQNGPATLRLRVIYLEEDFSQLIGGYYEMVVTGTITAK